MTGSLPEGWACMEETPLRARQPAPRIEVVAGWFDPEHPRTWSGVPSSIIAGLRRLGVYAGVREAMPYAPAARMVYRYRRRFGQPNQAWPMTREMRAVAAISEAVRRSRTPQDIDGWLHLCGGYGRVVSGRYVTLSEIPPGLLRSLPQRAAWFGYPDASRRQLAWVVRKHHDVYRHAYACCVASHWLADALVQDGVDANKVHVVGYGPNLSLQAPRTRDWSTPRFLFVGWDWARKNGDAVLRAFVQIRRERPRAQLDVVGNHPELALDGVTGHGPLSVFEDAGRARLAGLFEAATCFVLPSIVEPFGIAYVEAASAGVASVATNRGGTRDSVGEGGILVDPEADQSILAAMREMCLPETAQELGATALRHSKRLTWSATAERVLRAFDLAWPPDVELAEFLS
ncbi:MAG: glycosyltransferase family 4 protein [Mycobacteriales bacterium]